MGDLFSSFNPVTELVFRFPGNWVAILAALGLLPQGY